MGWTKSASHTMTKEFSAMNKEARCRIELKGKSSCVKKVQHEHDNNKEGYSSADVV